MKNISKQLIFDLSGAGGILGGIVSMLVLPSILGRLSDIYRGIGAELPTFTRQMVDTPWIFSVVLPLCWIGASAYLVYVAFGKRKLIPNTANFTILGVVTVIDVIVLFIALRAVQAALF